MSVTEIEETKSNIIAWIQQLSDLNMLSVLNSLRNLKQDKDWWEYLSDVQKQHINEGIDDDEQGRVISSDEFWKRLKMDENPLFAIIYTNRADADANAIKDYLIYKFSQKEVDNFYKLLASYEKVILIFPELYPISISGKNIRRAVLSKQLSIFYRIRSDRRISVIAILDNRMNPSKWP